MLPEPLWCLSGVFENFWCRLADQAELLESFERHDELIARRFDGSAASENAAVLRAMEQSRRFKEDQELRPFASSLSQVGMEYYRGPLELQPVIKNPELASGLLDGHFENVQEPEVAIQLRADEKGIAVLGPEEMRNFGCRCNWREEDIKVTIRRLVEWIDDDIPTEMAPIYRG